MPEHASFDRKTIAGQYVIMSKELPGFQVSAPSREEAEKLLPILLAKYLQIMSRKQGCPSVIESVEFTELKRVDA